MYFRPDPPARAQLPPNESGSFVFSMPFSRPPLLPNACKNHWVEGKVPFTSCHKIANCTRRVVPLCASASEL